MWNPSSTGKESRIQYLYSRIHSMESRIRACIRSPYIGWLIKPFPKVAALSNYFRQLPLGESEHPCSNWLFYPTSRGFSVSWLLGFTKSFAWLVCRVVGLFTPREKRDVNKPNMRQTSHANDFVNPKSHATEKPLLAGYGYWRNARILKTIRYFRNEKKTGSS